MATRISKTSDPPHSKCRTSSSQRRATITRPVEEKVAWTDDSDEDLSKLKAKKRKGRQIATENKRGRKPKGVATVHSDSTKTVPPTECDGAPSYLLERRRAFDRHYALVRDAGLLLPPDYSDLYFSDTERLAELEERPVFDEASGVKPCRPYEDAELDESAGLIPASIAQYLRDYQIIGAGFLHRLFVYQRGGILGDDMGLGKTVQVAAFLAAAFGKTGDARDSKRRRKVRSRPSRWYPKILIICPGSLIVNWKNELSRWGWWDVQLFHGAAKDDVLRAARAGQLEIMLTTYDTYKNSRDAVNTVQWDAVVADECHRIKDRNSGTTKAMNEINALCRLGLTGTAIQNKYEELWTLLDWTNPGRFGSLSEWNRMISLPLRSGQSHDATMTQLSLARQTAKKLVQNVLPEFFLRRMKTLIAHQLPRKTDRVVFCPLTDRQKSAYENFLASENVQLLRSISNMCSCGSGRKRGWCCDSTIPNGKSWLAIVFPSITLLQKLSNHVALLVPVTADLKGKQESEFENLRICLPEQWASFVKERDSMVNLANPESCGKWKVLKKLLRFWHDNGDKVLVFSHSVRLLHILQCLFNNTSYNVSYFDGSLSYEERQRVVDEFNADPTKFVFLISTKAGGVGLNITSANKVVIVDPHWNPSYDLQAQDRAYRIGQTRDVDVFRLVSVGTIEEIVYARQIYKQQQANIGYTASSERRYFKGVQENKDRQGEIFGIENLFAFHGDRPILRDIVNKTNIAEARVGVKLVDLEVDRVKQAGDDFGLTAKPEVDVAEGEDDGGIGQLVALVAAEHQQDAIPGRQSAPADRPRTDAIQAILNSAGVEYTHDNSEVVGSSKVEEQLSKKAELRVIVDDATDEEGNSTLFEETLRRADAPLPPGPTTAPPSHRLFNPPPDVMMRQFCSMARKLGFATATDFALVVEGWSRERRGECLEDFYRRREEALAAGRGDPRHISGSTAVKPVDSPEEERKVKIESPSADAHEFYRHAGFKAEGTDEKVKVKIEPNVRTEETTICLSTDDDDDDDEL